LTDVTHFIHQYMTQYFILLQMTITDIDKLINNRYNYITTIVIILLFYALYMKFVFLYLK